MSSIAEGYVRVALQLAQHQPELVDAWRGSDAWKPGPRVPVAPLLERVEALQRDLDGRPADEAESDRSRYLAAQLTALQLTAERLLGWSGRFDDEARQGLGVAPAPLDAARLATARDSLSHELPGRQPLPARYAAFKQRFVIPAPRIEPVVRAALAACREASMRTLTLPADESVDLSFVSGSPWDGYARYLGHHRTRVEINRGAALDVTRALRLACHEAYPGHHVQNLWIDDELVTRRGWSEFALTPAFGRHLLLTEGAAEAGADLVFPPEARVAIYRDVLLPAAGLPSFEADRLVRVEALVASLEPAITDVARAYLDNTLTQAGALERLRDEALTVDPEALLAFAERRRTRVMVYAEGRALVQRTLGSLGLPGLQRLFVNRPFALQ